MLTLWAGGAAGALFIWGSGCWQWEQWRCLSRGGEGRFPPAAGGMRGGGGCPPQGCGRGLWGDPGHHVTHGVRATSLSLTHTPPKNKPELSRPLRGGADRSSPAISSDHCVTSGCLLGLSGHTPLWWRTSPPCPAQALPPPALSPSCSYLIAGGSTTWKPASLFSSPWA